VAVNSFDEVAENYQAALKQNLRFIPGGVEYYYENRAKLAKTLSGLPERVRTILDFGGGVGLAIPHLQRQFAEARIYIYDASSESVTRAVEQHPSASPLTLDELQNYKFDMVFVAGVIHHIEPAQRKDVLARLRDSLAPEGVLCIFELNPLNPITRRLVSCCPFDEDASLISKRNLEVLLGSVEGLRVHDGGYTVFFPPILRRLRPIEKLLKHLPIGAQYYLGVHAALS
jgi:SAM-dependent methyltransferase